MMTNYAIIIPHKNIPDLLQRCLDSIPYRDDIQIIIVDDNSDPAIVDFTHFPGLGRSNTEIYFTKEGKGAGYARNVGLQHVKGKWLVFADADDFFMPCFSEMLDKYKDDENDIVFFKVTSVDSETLEPHTRHHHTNNCLSMIQKTNDWNIVVKIASVYAKFIKHGLIKRNNTSFQETQYSNDTLFSARLAILDIKRGIVDDVIYCITYRNASLQGIRSIESLCFRFQISCNTFVFLKEARKEKYFYSVCSHWWIEIFRRDCIVALSLLFKFLKTCGFWYTLMGITWNIVAIMKRYLLKNY